jgi:hypothetical protein
MRQERIEVDETAQRYIEEAGEHIHLVQRGLSKTRV